MEMKKMCITMFLEKNSSLNDKSVSGFVVSNTNDKTYCEYGAPVRK